MLIGCFSPLVKIFVPYYEVYENGKTKIVKQADLQDNFDLLFKEERFSFLVPRSSCDQRFIFGEPRNIADADLAQWLTGGESGEHNKETEWTGLAHLQMDPDVIGQMMAAAAMGQSSSGLEAPMQSAREKAKLVSEARIMRQVRRVYENYVNQVSLNKEQSLGAPNFSVTEYLCSKLLKRETAELQAREDARRKEMDELVGAVSAGKEAFGPRA